MGGLSAGPTHNAFYTTDLFAGRNCYKSAKGCLGVNSTYYDCAFQRNKSGCLIKSAAFSWACTTNYNGAIVLAFSTENQAHGGVNTPRFVVNVRNNFGGFCGPSGTENGEKGS